MRFFVCLFLFVLYFVWLETLARTVTAAEDTGLYLWIRQHVDHSVSVGQTQGPRNNDVHQVCGDS